MAYIMISKIILTNGSPISKAIMIAIISRLNSNDKILKKGVNPLIYKKNITIR